MSKTSNAKPVSATTKESLHNFVQIRPDLAQRVRFTRIERPNGKTMNVVRTRGLPKLVIRRVSAAEVIGHVYGRGNSTDVKATATSERAVFAKLVETVWNSKTAKQAWHPEAA